MRTAGEKEGLRGLKVRRTAGRAGDKGGGADTVGAGRQIRAFAARRKIASKDFLQRC
jgi:hypothetical protein